jgi:hypothetical protein
MRLQNPKFHFPRTTTTKSKFNGGSFGGGIAVGIVVIIVIVAVVYFLKCRKSSVEYNKM